MLIYSCKVMHDLDPCLEMFGFHVSQKINTGASWVGTYRRGTNQ